MRSRSWSVLLLLAPLSAGCSPERKPCKIVFPDGFEGAAAIVWEVRTAPPLPTEGGMLLIEVPSSGIVETSSPLQDGTIKDELWWRKAGALAPIPEDKRADRTTGAHRSCGSVEEIVIGDKARLATMKSVLDARLDVICGGPGSPGPPEWTMPAVDPGVGIGRVHLGMTRADLEKLGLPIKDGPMLGVGSYRVVLEADHVVIVEISLASMVDGVRVGGELVPTGEKDVERIAKSLPGCGKVEATPDDKTITCADGTVRVKATGPQVVVTIGVTTKELGAKAGVK
ncbi:MAG: hypothetical protein ABJE95_32105 [Byssovorax sp.]